MPKKPTPKPPRKSPGSDYRAARGLVTVQIWLTPDQRKRLRQAAAAKEVSLQKLVLAAAEDAAKKILGNSPEPA